VEISRLRNHSQKTFRVVVQQKKFFEIIIADSVGAFRGADNDTSVPYCNKEYEIVFASCNSIHYSKQITAYVVPPSKQDENTGIMHFAHGWGGNRFQYREMQRDFTDRYNLFCVSTEYRQSGFDFSLVAWQDKTEAANSWQ